jgi:steroid 5-alpha reductase family enzyme
MDLTGMVLYLAGSVINTVSELKRHRWKSRPKNQGYLYTGGLFKRVRHINYFGDILLFFGFALITQDLRALYIPLFMALNFVFILIPAKEAYLKNKYGDEFEEYSHRSKKVIPLIY